MSIICPTFNKKKKILKKSRQAIPEDQRWIIDEASNGSGLSWS